MGKFKVRVMENDVIKWVGRLSVMFMWEDQVKFQERVELSKQRQRNADDELRFLGYVDKQNEKVASSIQLDLKKRILDFA
jgi:dynein heavy chain